MPLSDDERPVRGLTRRSLGRLGVATILAPSIASAQRTPGPDHYRPQVHYSPANGFMDDPNGLFFHKGEYHLFYQPNPFEAKAGHVHWGHAVSSDLVRWRELPIALGETAAGQAFSGSAVYDRDNTSGLFPGGAGGLVAIYTRASDAAGRVRRVGDDRRSRQLQREVGSRNVVPCKGGRDNILQVRFL